MPERQVRPMNRRTGIEGHPRWGLALVTLVLAAALGACIISEPSWAITDEIQAKITEAQQQIEDSAAAYDAALARIDELTAQAQENEARIAQLQEELPLQRERSEKAMVTLYKMNREGSSLVDMVLSSDSIFDFLERVDFLSRVQAQSLETMRSLTAMEQELVDTQATLDVALDEAEEQSRQAELSLAAAKQAREQAQREAQEQARREREAQEAARKAAEAAAAEEAAKNEAAEDDKSDKKPESSSSKEEEKPPSTSPSDDGANWNADKQAFVKQWAGRIDRYLSGSPLAGKGDVFAAAAWDYGVDPRWSPAIAEVESSKGASCFRPHNAWGWGNSSWGSWDAAIEAHVAGLARTYGYTLTEEAAKKYCPPSWQEWYSRCASEMNSI